MKRHERVKRSASHDRRALERAEREGMIPQHQLPREKPVSQDELDRARAEGEGMFSRGE